MVPVKYVIVAVLTLLVTKTQAGGVIYTVWGSSKCSGGDTARYTGIAAGGTPPKAGGANILCLTDKPGPFSEHFKEHGVISGMQYNLQRPGWTHPSHKKGVPCAVCQSFCRHNLLLLPGRDVCPTDWNLEYKGFLMAGTYDANNSGDNYASEYICVNRKFEKLRSTPGCCGKLSVVKAKGAILRSQGYAVGKSVACALCSR